MRKTVLIVTLLYAAAAYPLTFGPEHPVSQRSIGRAPFAQWQPSVAAASDDIDFMVAWLDRRGSHGNGNEPAVLYDAHVWGDGEMYPPTGRPIAQAYSAAVSTSGFGYVLAWQAADGIYTAPIDIGGRVVVPPTRILSGNMSVLSLGTNGRSLMLLLWDPSALAVRLFQLHTDGALTRPIDVGGNGPDGTVLALDGVYHVVHSVISGTASAIVDDMINDVSGAVARHQLTGDIGQHYRLAAAASQDAILTAWIADQSDRALGYALSDAAGNVLTSNARARVTPLGGCVCGDAAVGVGWDGAEFVVGFQERDSAGAVPRLLGVRVNGDGTLIDGTPIVFSNAAQSAPVFAANSTGQLMVWSDGADPQQADVVARKQPFQTGSPFFAVDVSAAAQQQSDIAAFGGGTITVWRETAGGSSIAALIESATGATTPVAVAAAGDAPPDHPAVAATSDVALIVWTAELSSGVQVLGSRVRRDGTVLDAQPIRFGTEPQPLFSVVPGLPTVATNGRDFLVAWSGTDGRLHGATVTAAGRVTDVGPLSPSTATAGAVYKPHAIWTGSLYLVVWFGTPFVTPTQPPTNAFSVEGSRVTTDGVALDSSTAIHYFEARGSHGGLTATAAAGGVLIAFATQAQDATSAVLVVMTGTPDATQTVPSTLLIDSLPDVLDSATVGERTLVVWSDAHGVVVRDLGVSGGQQVIATDAYDPSIAAVGSHFVAAYTRTVDDVGRLFTVATPAQPRRRATSR